jgi:hypothetical protein
MPWFRRGRGTWSTSTKMSDHFYHVYAGGDWEEPVAEHVEALHQSGLASYFDNIYVGYVGPIDRIAAAEKTIMAALPAVTVTRTGTGWEQETMSLIPQYLSSGPVLYAHTKGASDPSPINKAWRRSMTLECIIRWERAVEALHEWDIAGCHWLMADDLKWFFGGTFWWANSDYLRTLPPVSVENRWQAEHWVGLNPQVRAFDLKPGHPGDIPLDTDWRL